MQASPAFFLNLSQPQGTIARSMFSVPEKYRVFNFINDDNDLSTIFSTEATTEHDSQIIFS